MSNPYTSQSISGYNSSPPSDDGSQTSTNEITWAKHKTKLGDPIKTLAEAINTELVSAFGLIAGANVSSHSSNYTVVAGDRGKFLSVTGTTTITLLDIATAGQGFPLVIVNTGSGTVTVDGDTSETINGSTSITINPDAAIFLTTDGSTEWTGIISLGIRQTNYGIAGEVRSFAFSSPPTGWLECDGSAISRTTYSDLFSAIGTTFGNGDGSTTFNIPDLRGEFVRGWDNGKGTDSGRTFGSSQTDEFKQHNHTGSTSSAGSHSHSIDLYNSDFSGDLTNVYVEGETATTQVTTNSAGNHTHSVTTNDAGTASETRPTNIALLYCIKT